MKFDRSYTLFLRGITRDDIESTTAQLMEKLGVSAAEAASVEAWETGAPRPDLLPAYYDQESWPAATNLFCANCTLPIRGRPVPLAKSIELDEDPNDPYRIKLYPFCVCSLICQHMWVTKNRKYYRLPFNIDEIHSNLRKRMFDGRIWLIPTVKINHTDLEEFGGAMSRIEMRQLIQQTDKEQWRR